MADWQRVKAAGADFEMKSFEVGELGNMIYIVRDPDTKEGYVIDAGFEPDTIAAEAGDTKVKAILSTHGHRDHHENLSALRDRLKVPTAVGELDQDLLSSKPDHLLVDRQELPFGKNVLKAIHTPGHTPGSTCFTVGDQLFSGDTLFPGGVGNTKNATGHFFTIIRSVEYRLLSLPDATTINPGHGKTSTIGAEKPSLPEWKARGW